MSKKIEFAFNGENYTLEYTKRTIRAMEAKGFVAFDVETKPMTVLPTLFAGAFLANHKGLSQEVIDEIYEALDDKEALIAHLGEMYAEQLEKLTAPGNVVWKANW